MKQLTDVQAAYIAGIMDGEGSICVNRQHNKAHHNISYKAFVNVTNTNHALLLWLKTITGIGEVKPKPRTERCKPCWEWRLKTDEMREFLLSVKMYMQVRKPQAELLLEFLSTCRYHGFASLTEAEVVLREVVCQEMEALNKRGS